MYLNDIPNIDEEKNITVLFPVTAYCSLYINNVHVLYHSGQLIYSDMAAWFKECYCTDYFV